MIFKKTLILAISFFLLFPAITFSQEKEGEIFKGTFFKASEFLTIEQDIDGDVIVMAKDLKINSNILGDVLAIAENIEINGDVEGDVRIMGKKIEINSNINRNVNIFAIETQLKEKAVIGKDILAYSKKFKNQGTIKGTLKGEMENIELENLLEGNAEITLSGNGKFVIHPQTTIKGNLTYYSDKKADISESAIIEGQLKHNQPKPASKTRDINIFGKIVSLFGMIALGMVALIIDKKNTKRAIKEILKKPGKSLLWGVIYFLAIPLVSIGLLFTLIGIPIAFILIAIYLILLYVGQVFSGIAIGDILFRNKKMNEILVMAIGLTVFIILASLPAIGTAFKILGIFIGIGAIINTKRDIIKETNHN